MKAYYLFEFMDESWVPSSLRNTLRDLLRACNDVPFRPFNSWVTRKLLSEADESGIKSIVEMGAGTAPLTRRIASERIDLHLTPTDYFPDQHAFLELEHSFDHVTPTYESVDFFKPHDFVNSLLVLSASFHHIRPEDREAVLLSLTESGERVAIIEGLRRTPISIIFCCFSIFPSLLTPLLFLHKPGALRRIFWCWVLPLAPFMFIWDGWISCLRSWKKEEWEAAFRNIGVEAKVEETLFTHFVSWEGRNIASNDVHATKDIAG